MNIDAVRAELSYDYRPRAVGSQVDGCRRASATDNYAAAGCPLIAENRYTLYYNRTDLGGENTPVPRRP